LAGLIVAIVISEKSSSAATATTLQKELQQRFRKYEIAHVNTEATANGVRQAGKLSIATPSRVFEIQLVQNDLRAPNYRAEEVIDGGSVRALPANPIRTYKGTVVGVPHSDARFTVDEAKLEGMIIAPDDFYFVEQARKYSLGAEATEYVVYKASDVIPDSNISCGSTLKEQVDLKLERLPATVSPEVVSPARVIELATEADFDYVTKLGGSTAANNEILSIMNQVQGIYESQVGLSFTVVFQHTWATAADPYSTTGNPSAMLQEFTDYWNANFASTPRDLAHLWTGRAMDSAGIAWIGVVCRAPSFSYGMSVQTSQAVFKVEVPAHEIGHTLGADHSDGQTGCANTIMQAAATGSTVLNFCQFSIDQLTTYVNSNSSCMAVFTGGSQMQFSSASYSAGEGVGAATLTINRTGDTSGAASVDFETSDGSAVQSSDYTTSAGTVDFAAGETSKTVSVLITDDLYIESNETINVTLSNPTGGSLGSPGTATLTITNNDTSQPNSNPLDNAQFFVRQHYYDFLNRLPDQGGLDYWSGQITGCGSDQTCLRQRRVDVSNAFFYELEFQQTGAYVYRLYRAAYGNNQPFPNPDTGNTTEAAKMPSYAVFMRDRAHVVGGSKLAESQLDLANAFVQRPEFLSRYPITMSGSQFVTALIDQIRTATDGRADLSSQSPQLITLFNQGGRGAVLYRLADDNAQTNPVNNRAFIDAEYNRSFVYTQYCGYLRRDADTGGFLFWLGQVNQFPLRDPGIQHSMVCAFITSGEYQRRFSPVVTHSNSDCG